MTCLRNLEKQPSAIMVRGARISLMHGADATIAADDDDDERSTALSEANEDDDETFWVYVTPITRSGLFGS